MFPHERGTWPVCLPPEGGTSAGLEGTAVLAQRGGDIKDMAARIQVESQQNSVTKDPIFCHMSLQGNAAICVAPVMAAKGRKKC